MQAAAGADAVGGRFLSLKWKMLALVSLVLAAVQLALVFQNYRDALLRLNAHHAAAFEERTAVLMRLLEQSEQRLIRLGNLVPGAVDLSRSSRFLARRADRERWTAVQLELQLDVMQLHDADGRLLARGVEPAALQGALQEYATAAFRAERPSSFILCEPNCTQFVAVPLLGPESEPLLLLLGTSLADVVLDLAQLSRATVAVLVEKRGAHEEPAYWSQYRLAAMSDARQREPELRQMMAKADLADLERGHTLRADGRFYRCYARPLGAFGGVTPGYFVLFTDATAEMHGIASQVTRQLATGLAALLAMLALLLAVLNRPMNRLRKLAQALPLLAHHQYEPVRQIIGNAYRHARRPTEIEVLESVAVDLAGQLEGLESTVAARSAALDEKVGALRRANELNDKIFATAPLLIVIQTADFAIVQMNEFGRQLLGYSEAEVRDMPFLSLLGDSRQREEAAVVLVDILAGRRPLYEQTGPVICVDGSRERITWLHTRLDAAGGIFLLSIGLPDKSLDDHYQPN